MSNRVYFDLEELNQGKFFYLDGDITTDEGRTFEIGEYIARGGHGSVYNCKEKISGEDFAIKFLFSTSLVSRKRFLLEKQLIQSLNSDHITRYEGYGKIKLRYSKDNKIFRTVFLIMELAESDLQKAMKVTGPLRYEQYAGQFRGLAQALKEIHTHAIHRDIKPENILITGERWQLSDYGLCLFNGAESDLTPDGINVGPKFWPSPESQNRRLGSKETICAASDVYQLAAIFWYVATGRHPTGLLSASDWIGPPKLCEFILKCLQHNHNNRPQNGSDFFQQLDDSLE